MFLCSMVLGGFAYMTDGAMAANVPDIKIAVAYPLSGGLSRSGDIFG